MKPKIVIDSISLLSKLTGIGRYTYEVSKNIEKLDIFESYYFYGLYSKKLVKPNTSKEIKSVKSLIVKNAFIKKIVRRILFKVSAFFSKEYSLYWQPNFIPNEGIKAKKIVTSVHDFSFILYKEFHPKERIEHYEKYFFKNIQKSDYIITGSNYSKKEILERLDFQAENIEVIYHGIDHNLFKRYSNTNLDFKLPQNFFLAVGSVEPRKNLKGLLEAYSELPLSIKQKYKLIIVGFQGWNNKDILHLIKKNKEYIEYLGFLSDEELAKVYNLASIFIFPSLYEGFGLPVLEAMACGTPVICSNTSSLPEVGGDAVVYFDPKNIDDIKNKIVYVSRDNNLQAEMIEKGLERAKLFTWEKSAQKHIDLFTKVLNYDK